MCVYNVSATLRITCNINVDANSEKAAKEEALGYFDNSANLESEFYNNICVMDVEIDDVND